MHTHTPHIRPHIRAALLGTALLLLSCTKTVTDGPEYGDNAIIFTNIGTKAPVESKDEIKSFSVWGWYADDAAGTNSIEEFDGTKVYENEGGWIYDDLKFWKSGKTYDFYALYPDTATLTTPDQSGTGAAESAAYDAAGNLTITNFDSTSGHDLMTASNTGLSGTNPPQSVAFTFSHELSRLSFKLESNAVTVISAALYGVDYRGTLTKSASSAFWSPSEGGTATQDSTPFEVENPAATEGTATLFDDILMIPHSDLTEAVLSISYRKNSSSDPDEIEKLSLNLSDTDVKAWEKGQSYRYTLQLNMGSISVNVSVLPWVQENTSVEW